MIARLRVEPPLASKAALLLAAMLAVTAGFQTYWAFGGTWGLSEALGRTIEDSSTGLQLASAVIAVALVAAILVVLGRVGVWRARLPFFVFRWGAWVLTAVLLLVVLANATAATTWERFVFAPFALALAALSALVALAPRPSHATNRREMTATTTEQRRLYANR